MLAWLVILGVLWLGLIALAACARAVNPLPGDHAMGLVHLGAMAYARLVHRLRVVGREHIPASLPAGRALIVVSNHKAGVDGVLISVAMPFFVRWVMAADMKVGAFEFFYSFARLLFVSRESDGARSRDLSGLREALRHLQDGVAGARGVRCLGIFPEGRLCRHRGQIYPFQPGVGLLIARSGALVLPVIVREASVQKSAYASLYKPSRSVLEVLPVIDYAALGLRAPAIVADLQKRYEGWVGPINHEPPLPTGKD